MTLQNQRVQKTREKNIRYKREQHREKNKIRRILKSSGLAEAQRYAKEYSLKSYLQGLVNGK